jgi:hypothetical protein
MFTPESGGNNGYKNDLLNTGWGHFRLCGYTHTHTHTHTYTHTQNTHQILTIDLNTHRPTNGLKPFC